MTNRITRSTGECVDTKAARLGSGGGEGTNQHKYNNMASSAAQLRCTPMPDWRGSKGQGPMQLRLIELDGAWNEPYVPTRVENDAAMSAATREGRAGR